MVWYIAKHYELYPVYFTSGQSFSFQTICTISHEVTKDESKVSADDCLFS